MSKEFIYKIIDNKITYFNLSDYIKQYNCFVFNTLLNALKLNKSITTLDLSLNNLYPKYKKDKVDIKNIILQLSTFINKKQNIKSLIITNTNLKLNDLNPLFEALQYNTSIKTLDLSNNRIDFFLDKKYYDISSNILKIQSLFYDQINETYKLENDIKTTFYQSIDTITDQLTTLKNNLVKNISFFKMLIKNKTLTTLNIARPNYNISDLFQYDNEINILSDVLQQNNTLKILNISYRCYSFENILKFIKNNKSIEILTLSLTDYENTKENLDLIRKYYNENDYLQKIIIN